MRIHLLVITMVYSLLLSVASFAQEEVKGAGSVSYLDLKPSFVVNYGGVGKLRYLKADIALRLAGGSEGQSQLRHHMPYIRHALVMRLSRATVEELSSMEGKELLRLEALEEIRSVLTQEEGKHFVDDLLFNSFIVQR